jgi:hypothetical protein
MDLPLTFIDCLRPHMMAAQTDLFAERSMKKIFLIGVLSTLSLSAFADYAAGPATSSSNYYTSTPDYQRRHQDDSASFSFNFNIPDGNETVTFERGHFRRHMRNLAWVNVAPGFGIPRRAVVGGSENGQPLFICHANYNGGVHPGKVVKGNCNISWGGNEIPMRNYQVLVSNSNLSWVSGSFGGIPANAVVGGFENGAPLYICQVRYNGGVHPGKIVSGNCNIGWGGREVSLPVYNVLVR